MRSRDLGQSFGSHDIDAVQYDTYRPRYPKEYIDRLFSTVGLAAGDSVLEIGAGTGIATLPLANAGLVLTAVEPNQHMIEVAQSKMPASRFPNISFVQRTFQEYFEGQEEADPNAKMIAAFTAFHWLEPVARLEQCRQLLTKDGVLAIGLTNHLTGGESDPLHQATMSIIESFVEQPVDDGDPNTVSVIYDGDTDTDIGPPLKESELEDGRFELVDFKKYDLQLTHTAAQYIGLMSTFSAVKALTRADRAELLKTLSQTIHQEFGNAAIVKFAPSLGIYRPKTT